jgi:hypothetical protein
MMTVVSRVRTPRAYELIGCHRLMNDFSALLPRYGFMTYPVAATILLTALLWTSPAATTAQLSALAPTKPVTICKAQGDPDKDFRVQTSGLVGADYFCTIVCQDDWRRCLRLTEQTENYGSRLPKVELPFVVDDVGGILRFALRSSPTITLHTGAGGTFFAGEGRWFSGEGQGLIKRLEEEGVRVVEVRWEWGRPPGSGWLTLKNDESHASIHAKVARPASVLKWVRTNLVGDQKLGTYGCSGGALQTLASTMWYQGVDEAIDYQFVSSMPLWDIGRICTDKLDGLCEHEPSRVCSPSEPCPHGDRCGYPFTPLAAVRALVDEVHGTRLRCTTQRYDPSFDSSSLARAPATHYAIDHPVDFSLNVYKTDQPIAGGQDDLTIGAFWQGAKAYEAIRKASAPGSIHLSINDNYGHCADGSDALAAVTTRKIKQGMKLPLAAPSPTFLPGNFCHLLDASRPVPPGFAAPYDTTAADEHLSVAVSCDTDGATVNIGTGSKDQLIYSKAYIGREGESDWQQMALSGSTSDSIENTWYRGMANIHVTMTTDNLAKNHYLLTYICTWIPSGGLLPGGQWKCGCRDEACATPRWNIQGFSAK